MTKISDKTKQYIQDYTKHCSNEITSQYDIVANHLNIYEGWLTVDNAESACMIEREEVLREVTMLLKKYLSDYDITDWMGSQINIDDLVYFINRNFKTK